MDLVSFLPNSDAILLLCALHHWVRRHNNIIYLAIWKDIGFAYLRQKEACLISNQLCFISFAGGSSGKESACNAEDSGLVPGKSPWNRKWQPTPVCLPGEFHGQRRLAGYVHGLQSQTLLHREEVVFLVRRKTLFWLGWAGPCFAPC